MTPTRHTGAVISLVRPINDESSHWGVDRGAEIRTRAPAPDDSGQPGARGANKRHTAVESAVIAEDWTEVDEGS